MNDYDIIGNNRVCSQELREYFKSRVGKGFHFLVPFQDWLKANPDKTLLDACSAYKEISRMARKTRLPIGEQFLYNIFIREQFDKHPDMTFKKAIEAWNEHKKSNNE